MSGRGPDLVDLYLSMKDAVVARGFAWELDWQADSDFARVREPDFLRESAWVILTTGFRESVVRSLFAPLSEAFCDWQSADLIRTNRVRCRRAALHIFRNERKIDAMLSISDVVVDSGFEQIRVLIQERSTDFLQTLPYIGSVTAFHLAKNLGLPVAKPDRHLIRMACAAGFGSPQDLCDFISLRVGDPVHVVDIVLWRYATLVSGYLAGFGSDRETVTSPRTRR
jgi:hypothetical protein